MRKYYDLCSQRDLLVHFLEYFLSMDAHLSNRLHQCLIRRNNWSMVKVHVIDVSAYAMIRIDLLKCISQCLPTASLLSGIQSEESVSVIPAIARLLITHGQLGYVLGFNRPSWSKPPLQPNGLNLTGGGTGGSFAPVVWIKPSFVPFNGASPFLPHVLGVWPALILGYVGAYFGMYDVLTRFWSRVMRITWLLRDALFFYYIDDGQHALSIDDSMHHSLEHI